MTKKNYNCRSSSPILLFEAAATASSLTTVINKYDPMVDNGDTVERDARIWLFPTTLTSGSSSISSSSTDAFGRGSNNNIGIDSKGHFSQTMILKG